MGYLGNPPTSAAFVTDTFNGTGSQTAYTMSVAPASTASMLVIVGAVLQDPSSYSIVGMTLNFSSAPPSGTGNISVRYMGIPAAGVVNTAYRTVTDMTATAGQATFTVPSYTVGFIDVFRNGARLGANDFTATNGTSITLAVAANANDLITTVSFSVASVLNAIPNTAGSVSALNLAPGAARANFGAGAVLQVVQGVYKGATTVASGSYVSIPVSATITPSSATSKILVTAVVHCGTTGGNEGMHGRLYRNGSNISDAIGNASGSRDQAWFHCGAHYSGSEQYSATPTYLDSPASTSALTYQIYVRGFSASYPFNINTSESDPDGDYTSRTISTITLMEIAA